MEYNEQNRTEEINMLQFISSVYSWMRHAVLKIFEFFGYLVRLLYRHKTITLLLLFCGLALGLYIARPWYKKYHVDTMLTLYGNEAEMMKKVCTQIQNNSFEDYKSLALPKKVTKDIISIRSFYVIDYRSFYVIDYLDDKVTDKVADKVDFDNIHSSIDTLPKMKDRLYLRIVMDNTRQAKNIQHAVLAYCNNNEVVKSNFETSKKALEQKLQICTLEMKRIDSLANISYFDSNKKSFSGVPNTFNGNMVLGEQPKQLFYADILALQDIKSGIELQLSHYQKPVEALSGFVVQEVPRHKIRYILGGILAGIISAIVLSQIIESRKKISAFLERPEM